MIVEGGHPGLLDEDERQARWTSDRRWATRFRTEPLEKVFTDWYQQPVFASSLTTSATRLLPCAARTTARRWRRCSKQRRWPCSPICVPRLAYAISFDYLYGERDQKFAALAAELTPFAMRFQTPDTTPTGKTPTRLPRVWLRYCVFE